MKATGMVFQGSYNDGLTAARRPVEVHLMPEGLRILDAGGLLLETWPYESLQHRDEAFPNQPLQLKMPDGDARLTLDAELFEVLVEKAPQLDHRQSRMGSTVARWVVLSVLAVAVLGFTLWVALPSAARLIASVIPVPWEVALGDQVYGQVGNIFAKLEGKERAELCVVPEGQAVLDSLTGRLAEAARSDYDFRVVVFDLDMPNAFALPGGRIVLMRGLLEFAESPDEVTGVLAHEMGHVIHRHGTEGIIKALGLAFFFGIMLGDVGSGTVGLMGETLVESSFSREAESEADQDAIDILTNAGLATGGLVAFFERLQEQFGDLPAVLQLLSSHPSHLDRQAMFAAADVGGGVSLSDGDWQSLRSICASGEDT